jgi:hypothetical protein
MPVGWGHSALRRAAMWHVDLLLGNGSYTRSRQMRHIRTDIMRQ